MKCTTSIFRGHRWSQWRRQYGDVKKGEGNSLYRRELQKRRCSRCGYIDTVWTDNVILIKDKDDE